MNEDPLENPDQESEDSDYEPVKPTKVQTVKWDDEENSLQPVEESKDQEESEASAEESAQEDEQMSEKPA